MYDQLKLSRYERILLRSGLPFSQSTLLAGIARSLRLSHLPRTPELEACVRTSSGLVAPLVFLYAWWVLHDAQCRGLKRLYFLARDGHIFQKVASLLAQEWHIDLDIRYVFCSRESLLLPSFEAGGEFERNWISWGYLSAITIQEICDRLNLSLSDLKAIAPFSRLSNYIADPCRSICRQDLQLLYKAIADESFVDLVKEKNHFRFELALNYFIQEGMGESVPFAIVDTGWRGSSHYALSALLNKGGLRPADGIKGYYLGLNCDAFNYENDELRGFLFDWRNSRRDYRLYNFLCFEMLFSADHGRTTGYAQEGPWIRPILADNNNVDVQWLITKHHELAIEFAKRATNILRFEHYSADRVSDLCRRLAGEFICSPGLSVAEVYGSWPMASEIREGDFQPMAPPMNYKRFFRCVLGRDKVQGFWPQASLIRGNADILSNCYNLFLDTGLLEWYRRTILRY